MIGILFRFLVLGTLLGAGIFQFTYDVFGSYFAHLPLTRFYTPWWSILETVATGTLLALISSLWVLGAVPALATGYTYVMIMRRFTMRNPTLLVRVSVGGVLGGAISVLFGTFPVVHGPPQRIIAWLVAGGIAGAFSSASIGATAYASTVSKRGELRTDDKN